MPHKITRTFLAFDADKGGGGGGGGGETQTVPYDRFKDVNDAKTAAELERDQLKAKLDEKERSGLSEVDALKSQVATLTGERDQAVQKAGTAEKARGDLERSGWVRDAAAKVTFKEGDKDLTASFFDAGDAIARINLDEIRSAEGAKREVTALAQRSRHLVQVEDDGKHAATGAEQLRTVLKGGEPVGPDAAGKDDPAAPAQMTEAEGARHDLRSAFAETTTP